MDFDGACRLDRKINQIILIFRGSVKIIKPIHFVMKLPKKEGQAFLALALVVFLLSACAQAALTSTPSAQPTTAPTLQPSPTPPTTPTSDATAPVVLTAKTMLAERSKTGMDAIQLVDIQPVQWPDSCLGVPQDGIMCAMHVVDGYRVILSVNHLQYEAHSNQDGSQMMFIPGPVLNAAEMSYSVGKGAQCQTYLFTENQDVAFGPCYGALKMVPYVEKIRTDEFKSLSPALPDLFNEQPPGFLEFFRSRGYPAIWDRAAQHGCLGADRGG